MIYNSQEWNLPMKVMGTKSELKLVKNPRKSLKRINLQLYR